MKFINIMPVPARQIPATTGYLGPNLSESQPTSGEVMPPSSRPIPAARDVAARLIFNSAARSLKNTESPYILKP